MARPSRPRQPGTTLQAGDEMTGQLKAAGPVAIHGTFKGPIEVTGDLLVGPTGFCEGDLRAASLGIEGQVVGDVEVENLTIRPTGKLFGKATYKNLALQDGGVMVSDKRRMRLP
ncbi:MAG: polymer-forming cytoskeletal protein [Bacillota bacterium]|nr:polymer-forming cytoskeletal protein [Bacillota bacterium]